MKIYVSARPNSKENKIEKISENHFRVFVQEPPIKGRANRAIVEALSEYLEIPKQHVSITKGRFTREKVVDIFVWSITHVTRNGGVTPVFITNEEEIEYYEKGEEIL